MTGPEGGPESGPVETGLEPESEPFEAAYDAATLAALDAWAPQAWGGPGPGLGAAREPARRGPKGWRGLTAGMALNAMVLGVGEALSDDGGHEAIVELRPEAPVDERQPVTFLMVPDAPRASRVIVRPWLLAG